MITSLFALGAAAFYGAADFLGGIATRRATTVATVLTTQGAGLLMLLLCTPLMLDRSLGERDIAFGALAGLTGSIGVALLYKALAIGPMSVVAPVTAVCAVIVPLVVGLLQGERSPPRRPWAWRWRSSLSACSGWRRRPRAVPTSIPPICPRACASR